MFLKENSLKDGLVKLAEQMKVRCLNLDHTLNSAESLDLDEKGEGGNAKFLLLADPDFAARGVDVRSRKVETTLILAAQFRNETQYQ